MPDPTGAVVAGRRAADSLMLDAGLAIRPTGEWETLDIGLDDDVEVEVTVPLFGTPEEPVRCKVKPPRTVVSEDEVGGRTAVTVPGELHLPARPEFATLTDGDLFEIVTVHPLSLSQVGRRYRIKGEVDGTLVTACRYAVERVVS